MNEIKTNPSNSSDKAKDWCRWIKVKFKLILKSLGNKFKGKHKRLRFKLKSNQSLGFSSKFKEFLKWKFKKPKLKEDPILIGSNYEDDFQKILIQNLVKINLESGCFSTTAKTLMFITIDEVQQLCMKDGEALSDDGLRSETTDEEIGFLAARSSLAGLFSAFSFLFGNIATVSVRIKCGLCVEKLNDSVVIYKKLQDINNGLCYQLDKNRRLNKIMTDEVDEPSLLLNWKRRFFAWAEYIDEDLMNIEEYEEDTAEDWYVRHTRRRARIDDMMMKIENALNAGSHKAPKDQFTDQSLFNRSDFKVKGDVLKASREETDCELRKDHQLVVPQEELEAVRPPLGGTTDTMPKGIDANSTDNMASFSGISWSISQDLL
jgi:hypothetical protein